MSSETLKLVFDRVKTFGKLPVETRTRNIISAFLGKQIKTCTNHYLNVVWGYLKNNLKLTGQISY